VIKRLTGQVVEHEPELRAQLRLSLDPATPDPDQLPFRKGRAITWIEDALRHPANTALLQDVELSDVSVTEIPVPLHAHSFEEW
jgi:hypothetical protein